MDRGAKRSGSPMSSSGLKQAALTGARWTLLARVGVQLVTWPVTILVMRLLDPGDYGLLAMAMVTIGFITLFSELGLTAALIQAATLNEQVARAACAAIVLCNVAIATLLVLLAPVVAAWFRQPELVDVIRTLTLELLLSSLAAVPHAQLERNLRFRQMSIASMAAGVVGAMTTLTLALLGVGVWALVFGTLAVAAVRSVLIIYFNGRIVWPAFHRGLGAIRPLVRFGGHVLATRALWYWYGQSDQVILARLLHTSVLGCYAVAAQLAMLPIGKAMEVVNRVSFPILSRMQADPAGLRHTHQRLLSLVATYAFGTCWGLAAVAPEFVAIVLGDKWQAATLPLMLLAAVAPLRMFSALNNTVTTAAGAPQASTFELVLAGVLLPLGVLSGALLDGLRGACLAWVVAYPIVYVASNALTCRFLGSRQRSGLQPLAAPLGAAMVMWLCIDAVRWQLSATVPTWLLLAVELAVGAASYIAALHALARTVVRDARSLIHDLVRPSSPTATDGAAAGPRQPADNPA
jgi:teichuronic acid exporter